MKHLLLLFFVMYSFFLFGEQLPHLVLYFDVNKTLIASDKTGNKSMEAVLNELLAEKYAARWDNSISQPITYDAYVHDILVPGPRDDQSLRKERKGYLHNFVLDLWKAKHPLHPLALSDYKKALEILNTSPSGVFPSFYTLLDHLDKSGISYSIVLRSFGDEIFDIKNEINAICGRQLFVQNGKFLEGQLFLEGKKPIKDAYEIYTRLRRIGHTALRDDWKNWDLNGRLAKYGKPFYIDAADGQTLSIFFDDNIRKEDSIENIIAPLDPRTGKLIPIEKLIEAGQAIPVDTLEAILDSHYYVKCVEKAICTYLAREMELVKAGSN